MKKHPREINILLLQLFMFYIFPLFCGPTDAMGMVIVLLMTTFILSMIIGLRTKEKLKLLYPIITAILFIPSVLIYYNETALVHSVWYLVASSVGLMAGIMLRIIWKKLSH